jgi:hypothetical protein
MITAEQMKDDYDWQCAFYEAHHHAYQGYGDDFLKDHPIMKVTHVYHAVEGERDQEDWLAVVGWSGPEGPFAVMSAGCDYTGWD